MSEEVDPFSMAIIIALNGKMERLVKFDGISWN